MRESDGGSRDTHPPDVPPDPARSRASSLTSRAVRSCARHVARDRRTLEVAEVALRTWKAHIRDMRMQSMGHLSPGTATQR